MTTERPILVVEDVEEISSAMRQLLRERGHPVVHATTAEQAIELAMKERPLLILTDAEMPAFEPLIERLRTHDGLSRLPVVVIDINDPKLSDPTVQIVPDFEALDDLIAEIQSGRAAD